MTILNRLNLLIRSNLNDALSGRSGDSSAQKTFQEMESSLRDARRQQIELRAGEKRLIAQIRGVRERADQWEERAMLALRAGDEQLAREALVVKNKALREAEHLREQLDEHRAYARDIGSALEALEMKLDSARGRIRASTPNRPGQSTGSTNLHTEAAWDAELRRRTAQRSGTSARPASSDTSRPTSSPTNRTPTEYDPVFQTDSQFQEFDRMSSKIESMEAEIDAIRELSTPISDDDLIDPRRAELEKIFNKMETKKVVSDDLADLKKKFE